MNDERLDRQIHAALGDCFAQIDKRPSQKSRILSRAAEYERGRRRAPAALVLATLLLTLLCGGAAAAKLGLFSRFVSQDAEWLSGERLAHLDEAAQTVGETVHAEEGFSLTLDAAYCDGDRLYFAYTLAGETQGFALGDGAALEDGTRLTIWDRGDEALDANTTRGFQEVSLPDQAAAGETDGALRVVLTVLCPQAQGKPQFVKIPFTVPLTQPQRLTGEAAFAQYAAKADLILTGVEISGEVMISGAPGWAQREEDRADADEDCVVSFQLIADGETLYNKDYTYGERTESGYSIPVRFDLPQSCERLTLRPVYAITGEAEGEDFAIELTRKEQ